ncbi:hypothetical protein ADUPG1_009106 [Aduncisulcus paluster]|uniref:Sfi1 spindle body domain-containing protein n=1 Tax=Aduncisulcus paluster TaxID=2918883 RepID=A0ABQ5KVM6_9EUKA|nr:hypothetical protein ADUPG1_009106 [Aduncisulcus paluster]
MHNDLVVCDVFRFWLKKTRIRQGLRSLTKKTRIDFRIFRFWKAISVLHREQWKIASEFYLDTLKTRLRDSLRTWRFMADAAVSVAYVTKRSGLMLQKKWLSIWLFSTRKKHRERERVDELGKKFIQDKIRALLFVWKEQAKWFRELRDGYTIISEKNDSILLTKCVNIWKHSAKYQARLNSCSLKVFQNRLFSLLSKWREKTFLRQAEKKKVIESRNRLQQGIRRRYFLAWKGLSSLISTQNQAAYTYNAIRCIKSMKRILHIWHQGTIQRFEMKQRINTISSKHSGLVLGKTLSFWKDKARKSRHLRHSLVYFSKKATINICKKTFKQIKTDYFLRINSKRLLFQRILNIWHKKTQYIRQIRSAETIVSSKRNISLMFQLFTYIKIKTLRFNAIRTTCERLFSLNIAHPLLSHSIEHWVKKIRTSHDLYKVMSVKVQNSLIRRAFICLTLMAKQSLRNKVRTLRIQTYQNHRIIQSSLSLWRYRVRLCLFERDIYIADGVAGVKFCLKLWKWLSRTKIAIMSQNSEVVSQYVDNRLLKQSFNHWIGNIRLFLHSQMLENRAKDHYNHHLVKTAFSSLHIHNSTTKRLRIEARMRGMCNRFIRRHESVRNRRICAKIFKLWCKKVKLLTDQKHSDEKWLQAVQFHQNQMKKKCFSAWRIYVTGSCWRSSHHSIVRTPSIVFRQTMPIPAVSQRVTARAISESLESSSYGHSSFKGSDHPSSEEVPRIWNPDDDTIYE